MTISMYAVSVPVFSRMLRNLLAIMDKAEASAADRKFDTAVLVADRLAPDMLPFKAQINIATDHAKGAASRLSGRDVPVWADDEVTFADLKGRVQKAIDYLATFSEADFAGAEDRDVTIKVSGEDKQVNGLDYLLGRAMPNFYFHVTTAYAILRHNGVAIGKRDFIG